MKDAQTILEEFSRLGTRCAFDLKRGRHYEGYIIEIEDGHLLFGDGGPLAPDEPFLIPADDVDLSTLAYWDEARGCYMEAHWDKGQERWMAKPARQPEADWEVLPPRPGEKAD